MVSLEPKFRAFLYIHTLNDQSPLWSFLSVSAAERLIHTFRAFLSNLKVREEAPATIATDRSMRDARGSLEGAELDDALRGEQSAWQGIQRAIDSLRDASPPPPEGSGGESSTEAERDRSLRDQVVEAMREGDRDGFDEDTKRYYEALLK